ncbi:hypothetical protein V3C99_014465, partial [Haemonchus contortus]|uniref:Cap-7 n=1 Tax=Haemonchus contortus TaxID=6289 RepID=A0A7I5ECD4_HAECO
IVHCPSQSEMTDEVRQVFLDKHNEYRSLVAKGEAVDARGGTTPKAAKLPKLTYDCEIESRAMSWIKKCMYMPSRLSKRLNLGENMFMSYEAKDNKTAAAEESTFSWFSSLQNVGIGDATVFNKNMIYDGVGYYTQLVWQNTHKIGCAVASCNSMTLVGCLYNPSGNIEGEVIYEIGEPCTGCTCSKDEGLCVV